jgi:hypothetical protein
MSIRRLAGTAAGMALVAGALAALTPGLSSMAGMLASAQRTADTAGPDVLVTSAAGLLAWAVWAWGALGLALTAASALPGLLGGAARLVLHVVLPAGARRSAALALGLGLGVAGPLLGTAALMTLTPASAAALDQPTPTGAVPDWPATASVPQGGPAPDWPSTAHPARSHVVVRGECLWHIASDRLLVQHGRTPTADEVATATQAWWRANTDVIGPDPDLLLPGQVLTPPVPP